MASLRRRIIPSRAGILYISSLLLSIILSGCFGQKTSQSSVSQDSSSGNTQSGSKDSEPSSPEPADFATQKQPAQKPPRFRHSGDRKLPPGVVQLIDQIDAGPEQFEWGEFTLERVSPAKSKIRVYALQGASGGIVDTTVASVGRRRLFFVDDQRQEIDEGFKIIWWDESVFYTRYVDGQKHGQFFEYWDNGQLRQRGVHDEGKKYLVEAFTRDGRPIDDSTMHDFDCEVSENPQVVSRFGDFTR